MTSVLVIGSHGCGLTTFVGLLYTAQVRFATEVGERFRFHADRASLHQLQSVYADLGAGRFPTQDVDWDEHALSFVLYFRSGRGFSLFERRGPGRVPAGAVEIRVGGISTEEVAELHDHDALVTEGTRQLLHAQVVVALLDAGRLVAEAGAPGAYLRTETDRQLAAALDLVGTYRAVEPKRAARVLHPLFVVTKADRWSSEVQAQLGAPSGPPVGWSAEVRSRVGDARLARHLPTAHRWLTTYGGKPTLSIAPSRWFFSLVKVEEGGETPRIARRSRIPVGGWEPEYPYSEYRALLEHLGALSEHLPPPGAG